VSRSYFKKPKRSKGISTALQLEKIKEYYPDTEVLKHTDKHLSITLNVKPTALSESYDLKIDFSKNGTGSVAVYVINQKLKIAKNRKTLPHVYDNETQKLCLFTPKKKEWNLRRTLIDYIIPWALEWLDFYEHWLISGEWLGGGHDEYATKND